MSDPEWMKYAEDDGTPDEPDDWMNYVEDRDPVPVLQAQASPAPPQDESFVGKLNRFINRAHERVGIDRGASSAGFLDTLLSGWGDEAVGRAASLVRGTPYDQEVQQYRQGAQRMQAEHPGDYRIGQASGMIAQSAPLALLPGGQVGNLGRMASAAVRGGGTAATMGAIQGAGESEAPLLSGETARRAATSAAVAAPIGAGLGALGGLVGNAGRGLRGSADELEARAAGLGPGALKRLSTNEKGIFDPEEHARLIQGMRDLGITHPLWTTPTRAGQAVTEALGREGEKIGSIERHLSNIGEESLEAVTRPGAAPIAEGEVLRGNIDVQPLIQEARRILGETGQTRIANPTAHRAAQRLVDQFSEYQRSGGAPYGAMQILKEDVGEALAPPGERAMSELGKQGKRLYGPMVESMRRAIGQAEPNMLPVYDQARSAYHIASTVRPDIARETIREARRLPVGVMDLISGIAGGGVQQPVQAGMMAALWRAIASPSVMAPATRATGAVARGAGALLGGAAGPVGAHLGDELNDFIRAQIDSEYRQRMDQERGGSE